MNPAKKALVSTKNFVVAHKLPIAVTATAATTAVVMHKLRSGALDTIHEFLNERGLKTDFMTYVAEKNQL